MLPLKLRNRHLCLTSQTPSAVWAILRLVELLPRYRRRVIFLCHTSHGSYSSPPTPHKVFAMVRTSCVRTLMVGTAGIGALAFTLTAHAQSGSRTPPPSRQQPATSQGSGASGAAGRAEETPVGLQGYCPVCLVEMKQWVKGDPRMSVEFDGHKYLFPGAEQAEMFNKNPAKYLPALGGDDVVHYSRTGKRVPGNLSHGVIHKGRNFFFASAETKEMFQANPASFENADLALGGECIVCRVGMNERVAGVPEFTVVHDGLRYQFPTAEQQAAFTKSPDSYLERVSPNASATTSGSGTRTPPASRPSVGGSGSR